MRRGAVAAAAALGFASVALFAAEGPNHRPFAEMKGGCRNFALPLGHEFKLWDRGANAMSQTAAFEAAGKLAVDRKAALLLPAQSEVRFAAKPGRIYPVHGKAYGGVVGFESGQAGLYRVSLGAKAWLDLVDAETRRPVDASSFEMQTGCAEIFKVVEYKLEGSHRYYLQLSSSPMRAVNVLVTRAL